MEYFKKFEENPYDELRWNIPERKQGAIALIGGNSQSFRTAVKIGEWLNENYPIEAVRLALPDALKTKLPPLPNLVFLESTDSGSIAEASEVLEVMESTDYNILIGDLSRNTVTAKAIVGACEKATKPILVTRDSVDLLASEAKETTLMNEQLILLASIAQLQKIFHAVYYPKVLMMTQPLTQVVEALHKFTLSYPSKIITIHNEQILIAQNGEVVAVPAEKSGYTPLTIWGGEFAAKISIYNLYNPSNFIKATTCAIFS